MIPVRFDERYDPEPDDEREQAARDAAREPATPTPARFTAYDAYVRHLSRMPKRRLVSVLEACSKEELVSALLYLRYGHVP